MAWLGSLLGSGNNWSLSAHGSCRPTFWKRPRLFDRHEKFNAIMVTKLKWTFDWKKFFIQRGERVGFGIAVVIMLFMVVVNGLSMAVRNGSATANAGLLNELN